VTGHLADAPALLDQLAATPPPALLAKYVQPPLEDRPASGLDLILEGFLLHHGASRVFHGDDRGPRVLAGDYCYAEGLVRVAESGDLVVIEALADLIALSASLVATDRRDALPALWSLTVDIIRTPYPARLAAVGDAKRTYRKTGATEALRALGDDLPATTALREVFAR
jgi:hypothetical protein